MNKNKEVDKRRKEIDQPKLKEHLATKAIVISQENFFIEDCCDTPHFGECTEKNYDRSGVDGETQ